MDIANLLLNFKPTNMKNITILAIGIMIGMSLIHFIRMKDKPKPKPFQPIEHKQSPVLEKYGKLIVD
jgi:hypothetical protein